MTLTMIVCSAPLACASAMINPNSVPDGCRIEVDAATVRLAIFLHLVKALPADIERAREGLLEHLQRNWIAYTAAANDRPDLDCSAYSDGLAYLTRFHAVLYEFKAFLDIFTRLMGRLIASPSPPPHGFNRRSVDGADVSGGKLIHWIRSHPLHQLPKRDEMADIVLNAAKGWITAAVDIRDTLGHKRNIPGFQHMRVSVSGGPVVLTPSDILSPDMPGGISLVAYSVKLREQLCEFVSELLPLIPRVDSTLNETWSKAQAILRL